MGAGAPAVEVSLIAAVARNGVIGAAGGLPWRQRADMRRFMRLTRGHAVVMGRKTWETMDGPLPDRLNLVVTRRPSYDAPGAGVLGEVGAAVGRAVAHEADRARRDAGREGALDAIAYVIGGAEIYAQAMPRATRLDLTIVEAEPEGDVRFPGMERGWADPDPAVWTRTLTERVAGGTETDRHDVEFGRWERIDRRA